jgi:putative hemolysin
MGFDEFITPIIAGDYTARLVKNEKELREYQDLRYKYLILEFDPKKAATDPKDTTDDNIGYDKETSQLCVFYKNPESGNEEVVGGYILMRYKHENSFCKATLKYDLSKLIKKHKFEILETTRAVTHPDHRNGVVLRLLWQGIEDYARVYNLRFIIGTSSFFSLGTNPLAYSQAASYLYHHYRMPEDIMVTPIDTEAAYYHKILPLEEIDRDAVKKQLPPILRGYLLMGAQVGAGFYIDEELKAVETFTILDAQKFGRYPLK